MHRNRFIVNVRDRNDDSIFVEFFHVVEHVHNLQIMYHTSPNHMYHTSPNQLFLYTYYYVMYYCVPCISHNIQLV